jgi:eukaryotic-like serine/threonine-protein kinase
MTAPSLPSRYTIHSLLGEGGSGRVYRVHDSVRDRGLGLKLVTPAESSWLRREFDTLRQIRHENLIQVFDWGALESGEAYYTMELIEGEDWGRHMGTAQLPEEVRRILTGLLRGLAHLHCHGEIHGDLKPGNILLGRGGVVKVTDVGMGGSAGEVSGMSGTPGYAAPEVWEGAKADVRSGGGNGLRGAYRRASVRRSHRARGDLRAIRGLGAIAGCARSARAGGHGARCHAGC